MQDSKDLHESLSNLRSDQRAAFTEAKSDLDHIRESSYHTIHRLDEQNRRMEKSHRSLASTLEQILELQSLMSGKLVAGGANGAFLIPSISELYGFEDVTLLHSGGDPSILDYIHVSNCASSRSPIDQ